MKRTTPALALTIAVAGLAVATPAQAATLDTGAFADAHVNAHNASANYGDTPTVKVDGRTGLTKRALLKFTVPAIPAGQDLDTLTLRLTPATSSAQGVSVYRTGTGWAERTVTWANQPTGRTLLGSSDALRAATTETIALDADQVTPGQVLSLRLETSAQAALLFNSSEGATPTTRPALRMTTTTAPIPTAPTTPTIEPDPPAVPPTTPSFPPAEPGTPKIIGMSAPTNLWDTRIQEVGANGVRARRIFADLSESGSSQLPLIRKAIADGMTPVISYKVPNPATLANGGYDTWLATLRTQLNDLNAPVTATFWHEPHGNMDPAVFRAASLKFFNGVDSPDIAVGPILNGWLLDHRVADFAAYTDANLLNKWEFVAVDSYQSGTPTNPGTDMPARAIPLLENWMDSVGHPDTPIGLGEYNGFSAKAITDAGEILLSTPEVWFGLAWNSTAGAYVPLTGDRITAFQNTKTDPRAMQ
jgi:hypothetical protein